MKLYRANDCYRSGVRSRQEGIWATGSGTTGELLGGGKADVGTGSAEQEVCRRRLWHELLICSYRQRLELVVSLLLFF